jgi:hypothetical protein
MIMIARWQTVTVGNTPRLRDLHAFGRDGMSVMRVMTARQMKVRPQIVVRRLLGTAVRVRQRSALRQKRADQQ